MEVNIGEIILEDEVEIGGLELDVLKVSETGGTNEIYIGSEEPTEESIEVWINPEGEADVIPTKLSQLENDKGFITLDDLPIYNGEVE